MPGFNSHKLETTLDATNATGRRRAPWPLIVVAALLVIVPFIAWYGTWFGRPLTDEQIDQYLSETEKPRHVQHALAEIERRISSGDERARRWYPRITALADSPEKEARMTAAWVMGVDTRAEEFRGKLAQLAEDGEPIVRRNAALSLIGFNDARCLPELRAMLKPFSVRSTTDGTALTALTVGSSVRREALLMRARDSANRVYDVRSPLDGKISAALIKTGDQFQTGSEMFVLAPDAVTVGDALEGLKRLGTREDLAEVERYAQGVEGMPDYIKNRAAQAAEAIKRRAG
jgi:hypothetical protein